jgi:hypothetical protein
MRFIVLGPFRVPLIPGKRRIAFAKLDHVYEEAREEAAARELDFDKAVGLYVLCLRPSKSARMWPYYVGQACRQTLLKRSFQKQDKVRKYNEILSYCGYKRASVWVFFIPLVTDGGRLVRKGTRQALIDQAEYTLIGLARETHDDFWNVAHRRGMDALEVEGLVNSKKRVAKAAKILNAAFKRE